MNRLSVKVASSISMLCMLFVLQGETPTEAKAKGTRPPQTSKAVSETLPASEKAQQIANALAELEKLAVEQVTSKNVPGLSISVVHNGKVIYAKGFGVREVNKPETIDENTVFQLASVSKSVTSSVVATLVSEGKLTWDTRICELDPKFQMYDPWVTSELTVKDLLCHRSGLPDHAGDLLEDLFTMPVICSRTSSNMTVNKCSIGCATKSRTAAFARHMPIRISGLQKAQLQQLRPPGRLLKTCAMKKCSSL